jgi:hypothetical protein
MERGLKLKFRKYSNYVAMTKEVLQSDQAHNAEVLALCPTENPVET